MKGWIGRSVWGSGTAGGDAGGLGAIIGTVGALFPRDPVWESHAAPGTEDSQARRWPVGTEGVTENLCSRMP